MTAPGPTTLPRVVVAAPSTGQGKTTVATGLMAALRQTGLVVSGHKVGPDYIDPGYHALASGRPGRNLDPHLVGEDIVAPLLLHGATTPVAADVAVVEGVMGLFDGRIGGNGFASTAHVATLTRTPVVLVLDVSRSSRSVGAIVHGLATWDPAVRVAGVILNQAGSARNVAEIRSAIDLPVLGAIPRDTSIATPARHLGLVTAAERAGAAEVVERLGEVVGQYVDLAALLEIARSAPELSVAPWDPEAAVRLDTPSLVPREGYSTTDREGYSTTDGEGYSTTDGAARSTPVAEAHPTTRQEATGRPVIAVAAGRAFTFRYAETAELLEAAGCAVVEFDPAADRRLPAGTAGLYLGGGFPEVHVADLSANASLRAAIRDAVRDGLPTVAECAGLLYLCRSLDGAPMVGALDADAVMTDRLTLRYPEAVSPDDTVLTRAGDKVTGHEFHRTSVTPTGGARTAWDIDGERVGFASPSLHASYLHTHWAGHPHLAARFARAVHDRRSRA